MSARIRILTLTLCLAAVAAGNKWYDVTAFEEWGEKEVQKMLRKSPWVSAFTFAPMASTAQAKGAGGSRGGRGAGATSGEDGGGASASQSAQVAPAVHIRAQWYSARPIRMALARQVQLLNPAANLELIQQFVETDPDDAILMLGFDSNSSGQSQARAISMLFARQTLESLAPTTEFTTKTKKQIRLKQYVPPSREDPTAKFVLPRTLADGRPLLEIEDKEASFRTEIALRDRTLRLNFRFKTKEMVFDGKLTY